MKIEIYVIAFFFLNVWTPCFSQEDNISDKSMLEKTTYPVIKTSEIKKFKLEKGIHNCLTKQWGEMGYGNFYY